MSRSVSGVIPNFPVFFCLSLIMSVSSHAVVFAQDDRTLADSVRQEFLHAWDGYKRIAWGHDEVKPLSREPHDWHDLSLCMTPVDAFDTMVLMGLSEESAETKKLIFDRLSFDLDIEVQAFEITIRLLGGLLSAFQFDGDERFLSLAEDLGRRLLPVYSSQTGMPYRYVHLQTGEVRDSINNPAEIGTALLEFGMLSRLTGDPVFYNRAKRALVQLFSHRSDTGLVGTWINVETGEWTNRSSHIGGAIDSYYEYLLKAWILFGDEECRSMWLESIGPVNTFLADTVDGRIWYGQADMDTGRRTGTRFGALAAFFPALLTLSGDTGRAAALQRSCYEMWNLHGIEPEAVDYSTMEVTSPSYHLRPEVIESAYYLYSFTEDPLYLEMGKRFFRSLVQYCRTEDGYTFLESVVTKQKGDGMPSFFLAETLKYLYLLFADPSTLPFDDVVFNTEAHPFRR